MTGLEILLGHLVGDYVLQNDWQAKNKTNPHPGPAPESPPLDCRQPSTVRLCVEIEATFRWADRSVEWHETRRRWRIGHLACTVHCLLYTLAVWAFTFVWMPWWGLLACFLVHWPVDRFRLARKWMENVSGQKDFATGVFAPWSVIVVDNIFHILTLYAVAKAAGL